jgi:hypothetical protein
MIEVQYDGEWPNACRGALKIFDGPELIYDKSHCCTSSGHVEFDDNCNGKTYSGTLRWDDSEDYSLEIQNAVSKVLDNINVCCGGCL